MVNSNKSRTQASIDELSEDVAACWLKKREPPTALSSSVETFFNSEQTAARFSQPIVMDYATTLVQQVQARLRPAPKWLRTHALIHKARPRTTLRNSKATDCAAGDRASAGYLGSPREIEQRLMPLKLQRESTIAARMWVEMF